MPTFIYSTRKNDFTLRKAPLRVKSFTFPGGEISVDISHIEIDTIFDANSDNNIDIHSFLYTSNDIIEMLLTVDAVKRKYPHRKIDLTIPYLPYARQDRVCNEGEAFSLKVFCEMVNALGCHSVESWDVHSDVASALLNNFKEIKQSQLLDISVGSIVRTTPLTIVCPDAGAEKKVASIVKALSVYPSFTPKIVYCRKVRDVKTGQILHTEVYGDVEGEHTLIVDDICDGGRTFIEISKKLSEKGAKSISLYVTHGIFSNGFQELEQYFDNIYCYHTFIKQEESTPLLKTNFFRQE